MEVEKIDRFHRLMRAADAAVSSGEWEIGVSANLRLMSMLVSEIGVEGAAGSTKRAGCLRDVMDTREHSLSSTLENMLSDKGMGISRAALEQAGLSDDFELPNDWEVELSAVDFRHFHVDKRSKLAAATILQQSALARMPTVWSDLDPPPQNGRASNTSPPPDRPGDVPTLGVATDREERRAWPHRLGGPPAPAEPDRHMGRSLTAPNPDSGGVARRMMTSDRSPPGGGVGPPGDPGVAWRGGGFRQGVAAVAADASTTSFGAGCGYGGGGVGAENRPLATQQDYHARGAAPVRPPNGNTPGYPGRPMGPRPNFGGAAKASGGGQPRDPYPGGGRGYLDESRAGAPGYPASRVGMYRPHFAQPPPLPYGQGARSVGGDDRGGDSGSNEGGRAARDAPAGIDGFMTAKQQLVKESAAKGNSVPWKAGPERAPPGDQSRRGGMTPGMAGRGGKHTPFVSPMLSNVSGGGGGPAGGVGAGMRRPGAGRQQYGGGDGGGGGGGGSEADEVLKRVLDALGVTDGGLPERLQGIELKLLDLIVHEILHRSLRVEWDDIAGLRHAKDAIMEMVVWPLKRPELFKGVRSPGRGLLLFGPPGTGKTMIGRAIASQANATFFAISASSLTSKWVSRRAGCSLYLMW
eukprot:jgi/Mesvir1/22726/Mv14131-RA.3